jgi:N-6 DNA Methylase
VIDSAAPLLPRIKALEAGQLFEDAGVTNLLSGDFFDWITDEKTWPSVEGYISTILEQLAQISFDISKKDPRSVRDLFKGIYEVFIPRELRHALGEIYTPDWLAAYVLDRIDWQPENDLLDPTCETGTFLLEGIKRRLIARENDSLLSGAAPVLQGIYGIDLNPLAVVAAKASLIVTSPYQTIREFFDTEFRRRSDRESSLSLRRLPVMQSFFRSSTTSVAT